MYILLLVNKYIRIKHMCIDTERERERETLERVGTRFWTASVIKHNAAPIVVIYIYIYIYILQ